MKRSGTGRRIEFHNMSAGNHHLINAASYEWIELLSTLFGTQDSGKTHKEPPHQFIHHQIPMQPASDGEKYPERTHCLIYVQEHPEPVLHMQLVLSIVTSSSSVSSTKSSSSSSSLYQLVLEPANFIDHVSEFLLHIARREMWMLIWLSG